MRIEIMLRKRSLCLLIAVLMMLPLSAAAEGWLSYENKQAGVKLKYPPDWVMTETLAGAVVAFGVPKEKANLKMVENVTVTVQDLTPDATLEKYSRAYEEQRKNDPIAPKVIESRKTTLGGLAARRIVCLGKQKEMEIEFLQVWTIKDHKSYLLTYGAEKNTYAKFVKEAEKIISSLVFV